MLLIPIIIFMPDSGNSCMDEKQIIQDNSFPSEEVNTMLSVEMGSTAVLCCSSVPLTTLELITWKITLRGQPVCMRAYKKQTNETSNNCTDDGITWVSRPDLSPHLQINAVAVAHDGNYTCEAATYSGYFLLRYELQVLVRPEANIFLSKNQTVVCEAVAGRPAARISWIPAGHCVTTKEGHSNGTVTVRSACRYPDSNVSAVTCLVSHSTGNKSLSEVFLPSGSRSPASSLLIILYVKLSVFIVVLVILGFAFYQKINASSKIRSPVLENETQT
ncbi:cell surface glycoprotein CD200 receptor 2 [Octodon degus]|uniref:Cell surface glycoprotein CD200 receptor 2 n=1 Tax=Octodon degus TaxID=10160 RepID=A0A6P6DAA0_OCTDE|nr:cell surface glycoprotein CD200 receptor 2 [Octodon degus]